VSFALLQGRSGCHISIPDLSKTKLAVALRRLHQVFDRVIHNPVDPLSLARFIGRSHGASCSLVESVNPLKSLARLSPNFVAQGANLLSLSWIPGLLLAKHFFEKHDKSLFIGADLLNQHLLSFAFSLDLGLRVDLPLNNLSDNFFFIFVNAVKE
jgi:hypothetical protein